MPAIGRRVPRREGPEKLTGRAQYLDDVAIPGCLTGVTLRSTIPHGAIRAVTFDPAFSWADFVVVTARDVPHNRVALIADDQPLLADTRVMHQMEPIALVAHRDRDKAYEALSHITVVYGPEAPVLTVDDALAATTRIYGDDNVFKDIRIERGDVDRGLAAADLVIEGEYHLPHQEHAYIENNAIAAWVEPDGTLVVTGSMQCPYYVHKALKGLFGFADRQHPGDPDRDRRRVWRQGRVSECHRRPRGAAGAEGRDVRSRSSTTATKTCWRRPSDTRRGSVTEPACVATARWWRRTSTSSWTVVPT